MYFRCLEDTGTVVTPFNVFQRFQTRHDLLRYFLETLDVRGARVECGAYRGATALLLCNAWRSRRAELFATHPQSPIPPDRRAGFDGPRYFDYDASFRVGAELHPCEAERFEIPTSGTDPMTLERVGRLSFELAGARVGLDAYWLTGYAGGLFVPFRDATAGRETYGGGRYLWDSAKGADLGSTADELNLDNFQRKQTETKREQFHGTVEQRIGELPSRQDVRQHHLQHRLTSCRRLTNG